LYLTRNAYENGDHNIIINKGKVFDYNVEFLTVEQDNFERIDQESEIYQKLIKNVPLLKDDEDKQHQALLPMSISSVVARTCSRS